MHGTDIVINVTIMTQVYKTVIDVQTLNDRQIKYLIGLCTR